MNSRTWTIAAALVAVAAPTLAAEVRVSADDSLCRSDNSRDDRERHCEVREATLPAGQRLHVDSRPNGGIHVRGWDRGEIRLRVVVVANADTVEEARGIVSQVRVETDEAVRATGPRGLGRQRNWWASFHLDVPRDAELDLQADNGGLHVAGVAGHVRLTTVNGGIHLEEVGGRIEGTTANGGLHVQLSGAEWKGEGLDVTTTNGGVHLQVPEGYNARLTASTVNGGVHSDLAAARGEGRRRRTGGRIETDLGRGGAPIRLTTTNGGLHIDRE